MHTKAMLFGQGLDCLTFVWIASIYGVGGESNPVARLAFALMGVLGIIVLKLVGTAALFGIVQWTRRRGAIRLAKIEAVLVGSVGVLGAIYEPTQPSNPVTHLTRVIY